jgi:Rieske Fe-S protein
MDEDRSTSRGDLMKMAVAAIGGLIGAALGFPAIAYVLGPALKRDEVNLIRLTSVSAIEVGTPSLFKARVTRQDGWVTEDEQVGVYVLTEDGRDYHAMSNICTHLGCRVRWVAEKQKFFSPCHNGVFDKHGFVVSGPPPRPLDEFVTKVEDGGLFVQLPAVRRS